MTVYERNPIVGGKARSIDVPGTGTEGRPNLPGEHGFRFFPGFYRHLDDTLARIPVAGSSRGVLGRLVDTSKLLFAPDEDDHWSLDMLRFPPSLRNLERFARNAPKLSADHAETRFFLGRALRFLVACDERREAHFEHVSWWDFVEAERFSSTYQKSLAEAQTKSLVACSGRKASTRTVGRVGIQLHRSLLPGGGHMDRVLDGPTSEVWLEPWMKYLSKRGVRFATEHEVEAIHTDNGCIRDIKVRGPGGRFTATAAHYVCAVPLDVAQRLFEPEVFGADPSLRRIGALETDWMVGCQFYLRTDPKLVHGHGILVDSPWALTVISQAQFWTGGVQRYGDGTVRGILSVDISDWDAPGTLLGKKARDCSASEIRREVWHQMERALNRPAATVLRADDVVDWFLDPAIEFGAEGVRHNREPLLINTKGSLGNRPQARTAIPNLVLAADYVQTHVDLATMEAANEAARRAVNVILERTASGARPCDVWPMQEPRVLGPLKALDRLVFHMQERGMLPQERYARYMGARPAPSTAEATRPPASRSPLRTTPWPDHSESTRSGATPVNAITRSHPSRAHPRVARAAQAAAGRLPLARRAIVDPLEERGGDALAIG